LTGGARVPIINPIRWGTAYKFWFDADAEPSDSEVALRPYVSGIPREYRGPTRGPTRTTTPPIFRRGDVDENSIVEFNDAIDILKFSFLGSTEIPCRDAADADDDSRVDQSDVILILSFLFLGQFEIPAPGPVLCGIDPTDVDPFPRCVYNAADCEKGE
jgi:hypothetical protein